MTNKSLELRSHLVKFIDWLSINLNQTVTNAKTKHIMFINWNGKYGDAITSSPIIEHLRCNSDIKISVITTPALHNLYSSIMKVDSIYLIESVTWKNVVKLCSKVEQCDAVIPLFGKLGLLDMLCILLLKPRHVFTTDESLRIACAVFIKESTNKDVYQLYELITRIIEGEHKSLVKVHLNGEQEDSAVGYDYLINPFGSRKDKSLTMERTQSLIQYLVSLHQDRSFGILYSPDSITMASKLVQMIALPNVELVFGISHFEKVIPIIHNSGVLISVDTSLVHIARVLNKPVVAIYPETSYFNIWQPANTSNFQVIKSTGLIDFGDVKNMNKFDNKEVDYALNRLTNIQRLENKKVVFLYWHSAQKDMPIGHTLNIKNLKNRLNESNWEVIVTTLDSQADDYIENYIELPSYFNQLVEKTGDEKILHGNQSDIIRLRLLETYGGIYLDTSTIFLKHDFEEISLYKKLMESSLASLAGYTNVTFTRKNVDGDNYFEEAKDGMELSILFAKKNSNILQIFNREIDQYWKWKTANTEYKDYPPFKACSLGKISFLNEYHIHYSLYHLIITRQPELLKEVVVRSMHMNGKETSVSHGPYAISDLFCRGKTSYEPALPHRMLQCFIEGSIDSFNGKPTTLNHRIEICKEIDLLKIPAYMRTELEKEFTCFDDYLSKRSLYLEFYSFLSTKN